jgi:hypothetical protein
VNVPVHCNKQPPINHQPKVVEEEVQQGTAWVNICRVHERIGIQRPRAHVSDKWVQKCPDPNSSLDAEPCAQQRRLLIVINKYYLAPGLPVIATLSSKTNGPWVEFPKARSAIAATTATPLLQIGKLVRFFNFNDLASVTVCRCEPRMTAVCNKRSPKSR